MTIAPPALEIAGMSKRFGPLAALRDVSLRVPAGSFHALLGENGAGKSTLVKCLMGYQPADEGDVVIGTTGVAIRSPRDAHRLGLGMVYQHFTQVPSMSVAENLVLMRPDLPVALDWRRERARIDAFLADAPFRLDPDRLARDLAAGEKQKLEILKQLFLDRRILILDEPTSVLTPGEADEMLGLLKRMVAAGRLSVIMITHKLREVFAYADSVTVLRRGRVAGRGDVGTLTPQALARMMIGEAEVEPAVRDTAGPAADEPPSLVVQDLHAGHGRSGLRGLSLAVRPGETLGIAGVSGNGQRELVQALAGQIPVTQGMIRLKDEAYRPGTRQRRGARLAIVPEEPRHNACAETLSVARNLALDRFDRPPIAGPFGWLRFAHVRRHALDLIERFNIRCPGPDAPVATLSGGNVQRLVLARTLEQPPAALVLANPPSAWTSQRSAMCATAWRRRAVAAPRSC